MRKKVIENLLMAAEVANHSWSNSQEIDWQQAEALVKMCCGLDNQELGLLSDVSRIVARSKEAVVRDCSSDEVASWPGIIIRDIETLMFLAW